MVLVDIPLPPFAKLVAAMALPVIEHSAGAASSTPPSGILNRLFEDTQDRNVAARIGSGPRSHNDEDDVSMQHDAISSIGEQNRLQELLEQVLHRRNAKVPADVHKHITTAASTLRKSLKTHMATKGRITKLKEKIGSQVTPITKSLLVDQE